MKTMSDPVKSSEIEDVLASIRRLVSEEARGEVQARRQTKTVPAPDVPEAATEDEPNDALVLTPALRVHEGGKAVPDPAAEAEVTEETVSEGAEAEAAPEEAVDIAEDIADDIDAAVAEAIEEVEVDLPDLPDEAQTLETKIAALEALIASGVEDRREQQEAETPDVEAEELMQSEDKDTALDWEDHDPEMVDEGEWGDDVAETEGLTATYDEFAFETVYADEGENAGIEIGTAAEEPVPPEGDGEDAAASEEQTDVVADSAEEGETAEASEDALGGDPLLSDADADADAGDAMTIDEAALRELVIEIVREELQGALGERITRNVRRLVRREIHRALASQELD